MEAKSNLDVELYPHPTDGKALSKYLKAINFGIFSSPEDNDFCLLIYYTYKCLKIMQPDAMCI